MAKVTRNNRKHSNSNRAKLEMSKKETGRNPKRSIKNNETSTNQARTLRTRRAGSNEVKGAAVRAKSPKRKSRYQQKTF